jgi:hypothetical protein
MMSSTLAPSLLPLSQMVPESARTRTRHHRRSSEHGLSPNLSTRIRSTVTRSPKTTCDFACCALIRWCALASNYLCTASTWSYDLHYSIQAASCGDSMSQQSEVLPKSQHLLLIWSTGKPREQQIFRPIPKRLSSDGS